MMAAALLAISPIKGEKTRGVIMDKDKLKGKGVSVRGQVVKFTPAMGKYFLHLRDGTGSPATR